MNIFHNISNYQSRNPLALSLGMFDGVHLGHQGLINGLKHIASEKGLEPSILTFWPHPRLVFNPNEPLKLLNTIQEKTDLLQKFGVQNLFLQSFDEAFRNLSGEAFVREILVKTLNVKHLIIGYDHTFGKNKSGNFQLLQQLAPELGFEVEQKEAINLNNANISSTKIRTALCEGNILDANEMLGYPYPITGTVVHGKKLGRTIGFPTANIATDPLKILPKKGAYIVEVLIEGIFYRGMLSVGTNPTVNGEQLTVEVNILDFNGDLYDKEITVKFRAFLHEEIKFENLDQLIEKLKDDQRRTEEFFTLVQ